MVVSGMPNTYRMFFTDVNGKLSWINRSFESDAAAIEKAQSLLKAGESVKVYALVPGELAGRTVFEV